MYAYMCVEAKQDRRRTPKMVRDRSTSAHPSFMQPHQRRRSPRAVAATIHTHARIAATSHTSESEAAKNTCDISNLKHAPNDSRANIIYKHTRIAATNHTSARRGGRLRARKQRMENKRGRVESEKGKLESKQGRMVAKRTWIVSGERKMENKKGKMRSEQDKMESEKGNAESKIGRMENHEWETESERVLVMQAHASGPDRSPEDAHEMHGATWLRAPAPPPVGPEQHGVTVSEEANTLPEEGEDEEGGLT